MGSLHPTTGPHSSWTVSNGIYTRPYGIYDHVYMAFQTRGDIIGQQGWRLVTNVTIKPVSPASQAELVASFKEAWRTMRYYYPIHGQYVDNTAKTVHYKVASDSDIEKWVDETFVVSDDLTTEDLVREISNPPWAMLYFLPKTSELVYMNSHLWMDGMGAIAFWLQFFTALDSPEHPTFGDEAKYLAPASEIILGCPLEATPEMMSKAKTLMDINKTDLLDTISFPHDTARDKPSTSRRATFELDQETTLKLIVACKQHKWSVTAAFHAAAVEALFLQKGMRNAENGVHSSIVPYNMREHIDPDIKATYPLSNMVTGPIMSIKHGSFADMAAQANAEYRKGVTFPGYPINDIQVAWFAVMGEFYLPPPPPDGTDMSSYMPPPGPGCNSVAVSSLGLIEKTLPTTFDKFEVLSFWEGVRAAAPEAPWHFWTFRGKFTANVSYNEAYIKPEVIERYVSATRRCLLKGLGIEG